MTNPSEIRIKVTQVGEGGYLIVDGKTYTLGEHALWNYEEDRKGSDFQQLVREGKIVVLRSEEAGASDH